MSERFQIRLKLTEQFAKAVAEGRHATLMQPLADVLKRYNASVYNQLWAFEEFLRTPESRLPENAFTRDLTERTVANPAKREKYSKIFIVVAGGEELFTETPAVLRMMADLKEIEGGAIVAQVQKIPVQPFTPRD